MEINELDHRDIACASQIRRVLFRAYSIEAQLIGVRTFPPLERVEPEIVACDNRFQGIYKNGSLAGFIEVEICTGLRDGIVIASLCVDPSHARQGIGSRLLKHVMGSGPDYIQVSTAELNAPAIALYEKVGFSAFCRETNRDGIRVVRFEMCCAA